MGCSQGAATAACTTEQSFCTIKGQAVKNNSDIASALATINQNESIHTAQYWNSIYTILKNINSYGSLGTRNPDISNLKDVTQYSDTIVLQLYNDVLNRLGKAQLAENSLPIMTKTMMDNIQTFISDYQLNKNRCNTCNTQCNATCEASTQCSSACEINYQCYQCGSCEYSSQCGACQKEKQFCLKGNQLRLCDEWATGCTNGNKWCNISAQG